MMIKEQLEQLKWVAAQGASFALPKGRTKDKFELDWPNKPHTLDEAIAHAKQNGNVGILTGKYSNNIVALDRDIDFPGTAVMLGDWGKTAKIVRTNAPDRGKFLYRVDGKLPDSAVYKPDGKHPHAELLANGRHALGPTSQYNGGVYILQDVDMGIMEVTPAELNYIWWTITAQHLYAEFKPKEPDHGDTAQATKNFVQAVNDAWSTIEVFKHYNKDTSGTEERKGQTRLLGNGGLDVKGNEWYCHSAQAGGYQIAAWYWCKTGQKLEKGDKKAFWDTVNEMADVKGIARPQVHVNGHSGKTAKQPVNTGGDEPVRPDLLLSVDEVLQAISDIGATQYTDLDTDPEKAKEKAGALRKARIVKDLGFAIGELERTDHALVIDTLVNANAGFTQTAAKDFIRGCVADTKKRHKEATRQRAEQARENLLAVRAKKGKRSIDTGGRQLSDVAGEALEVLKQSNSASPRIFVRNGALSRIAQDERGFYGIQEIDDRSLLHELSEVVDWETVVVDANGIPQTKAVDPPINVIREIFGRPGWPEFPPLAGVVTSPVFSRDGVLHHKPGYNPATRLFYTGGVKVGDTTPTPENIERAKDLILNNLLVDFPYKDEASRAHAVAYLLLPFVRDMIDGPTPVHTVDSPTPGSGKGMEKNACAFPFLGHDVPTMAAANDDDEWRKRITSSLMNGSTHLVIDNVNDELDSGSLASAFTQPVWEDRMLGGNRQVKIPIRTIWAITANNIKMSQELARRSVWIRLDANVEKPWLRTEFKHKNLMGWARANRDELVTAALTLIRAWIEKRMPLYTKRTKGSYESWAGVMGGILEAVGIPGFLDNEAELYDRVVSKNDLLVDFVKAWGEKQHELEDKRQVEIRSTGKSSIETCLSSYELFKLASYADDEDKARAMGETWQNLLGDMLNSQKQKGRQTQLGKILDTHLEKVVAGYKINLAKTANGSKFWLLKPVSVEPKDEVLPGSTGSLPPVAAVFDKDSVEPVEPVLPATHGKLKFFSHDSNRSNGQEKNNSFHIEPGAEGSTGSTDNATNKASTSGRSLVEPQKQVLPKTEVLPENEMETWAF